MVFLTNESHKSLFAECRTYLDRDTSAFLPAERSFAEKFPVIMALHPKFIMLGHLALDFTLSWTSVGLILKPLRVLP